ncbi:MAG: hypothetical protein Q9220_006855 [cf. Caloplaca sp. 1 TL-2023]
MKPPCVGYLDSNRRWNHLTNIEWEGDDKPDTRTYVPLENVPQKMAELNIEWRPRTSLGVREIVLDATGESPSDLPAGGEASIRYVSKTRFGAILIAQKPVTLASYNDETLFRHWLNTNRAKLAQLHGVELSRYGLWLVTRTYTTPRVSINAWEAKDKDASMSVKVKANMMGDIGGDVDWSEKSSDKDWAHYSSPHGVVAFFDGIEVPAWQWWFNGVKARVALDVGLVKRQMMPNKSALQPSGSWRPSNNNDPRRQSAPGADDVWAKQTPVEDRNAKPQQGELLPTEDEEPSTEDVWGSWSPLRATSPLSARSLSRGRPGSSSLRGPARNASSPTRLSKHADLERYSPRDPRDLANFKTRLSTASTAAGNSATVGTDYYAGEIEEYTPAHKLRQELRRKTSSPSLRKPSAIPTNIA